MEILERISHVQAALSEDTSAAISLMAESVFGFFDEGSLREALQDPRLSALFALAEDANLDRASLAKHSAEAWKDTARARKLHSRSKVSLKTKLKAHDDAESSHMFVAMHHDLAGNKEAANKHYAAADHHWAARKGLGSDEAITPPKSLETWMESLEEGGYSDEVKNASMNAAKATAKAKQTGDVNDHATASVAHRIARDLAKSGGHSDLAAKHDTFHQQHAASSKAAKVA